MEYININFKTRSVFCPHVLGAIIYINYMYYTQDYKHGVISVPDIVTITMKQPHGNRSNV